MEGVCLDKLTKIRVKSEPRNLTTGGTRQGRRPRRKGNKKSVKRTHVLTTRQKHDDSTADTTRHREPHQTGRSSQIEVGLSLSTPIIHLLLYACHVCPTPSSPILMGTGQATQRPLVLPSTRPIRGLLSLCSCPKGVCTSFPSSRCL